jgi:hypothetical protein
MITEYTLSPNRATAITSGPDGRLWFVWANSIGAITTGGTVSEYPVRTPTPPFSLGLFGMTVGPDKAIWFTEAETSIIGRITTTGQVTEYTVPTPNSLPLEITRGPEGALWFTEAAADKIGKIVLPDTTPPLITLSIRPTTLWPSNGTWLLPVMVWGKITDTGSGLIAGSIEFAVTDEYHLVQPKGHLALDPAGNYLFTILLNASCRGNDEDGRWYSIRVTATDNAGNRGVKRGKVIVPHDKR